MQCFDFCVDTFTQYINTEEPLFTTGRFHNKSPCNAFSDTGRGQLLPLPFSKGNGGGQEVLVSCIENDVLKFVYHDFTSMKHNSACFSSISWYMALGIMPQGALQRKSAPLRPTTLPISLNIVPFYPSLLLTRSQVIGSIHAFLVALWI